MSYKTAIIDIAKELNTTPATVSRALSNHPGISEKTKQTVQLTASKLNYKRNRIASSMRSGKTHVGRQCKRLHLEASGVGFNTIRTIIVTNRSGVNKVS